MSEDKIKYRVSIDPSLSDGSEELGISMVAYTSTPAIMVKGMAYTNHNKEMVMQSFSDDLKYRIVAPALIPMEIYRSDEHGEYYVEFTRDEIELIYSKLMKDRPQNLFNLEHVETDIVDSYLLESWLVGDDPKADRSYSQFGIEVPTGTLMIVSQFNNKDQYHELVKEGKTGFSIEGFLGLQLQLNKQNKIKTKMEENKLMLPDGEHTIGDKIYVVEGGVIIEVKDVVVEEAMAEDVATEEVVEEVLAEDVVEETVVAEEELAEDVIEEVVEEELAVDPIVDEVAILAIIQPKLDEIYDMIAEIKSALETEEAAEDVVESVEMSIHSRFAAVTNFLKK